MEYRSGLKLQEFEFYQIAVTRLYKILKRIFAGRS